MAGYYNKEDEYNSIGIPGSMPKLRSITIADTFGKELGLTAEKLSEDREKVSQEEKILNDTFRTYQTKLREDDLPYFNKLTNEVRQKIHNNPFNVPMVTKLASEFMSDKELVARMTYNDEDKKYREKIDTMPGIGSSTKKWWNATHKANFQPVYDDNGQVIGGKDYQYSGQMPLLDIDWVKESRELFTLVSPERFSTKSTSESKGTSIKDDGTYWTVGGGGGSWKDFKHLDVAKLKKSYDIWYNDNRDRVAQMWKRDLWLRQDLKERLKDPTLSVEDRQQLNEELEELERVFKKTKAGHLKEYAFYRLTEGNYAEVFAYTDTDVGSVSSRENLYSGDKNSRSLNNEDIESEIKAEEEVNKLGNIAGTTAYGAANSTSPYDAEYFKRQVSNRYKNANKR